MLWIEISKRIFEEEDEEDRAVVAVGEVTVVAAAAAEVTVVAAVEVTRLLHKIKEVTHLSIAGLILLHRFLLIQVQAVATKAQSVRDGLVNGLDLDPLRPHVKKKLVHPNQCLLDDFHRTKKEKKNRKNALLIKIHLKEEICLFKGPYQGLDLDHPSAS
mmetsp:Transcript_16481/g.16655  ORF Transcript_16481/g.16655 Transcript_16481/m.16655 type:complete len:159 (-) Transcript_16481:427-903(-)